MVLWPRCLASTQLKLPQIQKIMMEFEKQSEIMDMKEEMMNDAIDDAMGDEDDEDERWDSGNTSLQNWLLSKQKTLLKTSNNFQFLSKYFIYCQLFSVAVFPMIGTFWPD